MEDHSITLSGALAQFLPTLPESYRQEAQQELNRFILWCGRDLPVRSLTPTDVEQYAEFVGAESARKLEAVKGFLSFLKRKGIIERSLAPHLRAPRGRKAGRASLERVAEEARLSPQGYAQLKARLEMLKEERVRVVEEIHRAMADKDFRENAPLEAARERQGFIEARIRELEELLGSAVVSGPGATLQVDQRVRLGTRVTLREVGTGRLLSYTLVDPREADPAAGKLSVESPVGRALLDRSAGEEVSITVPRGTLRYVVERVEE